MALIRWEPRRAELHPLRSLEQEMERFFNGWLSDRSWPFKSDWLAPTEGSFVPSIDLKENESDYVLTAELPGMSKDDVEVNLANNVVTLSGERREEKETKEKSTFLKESFYGSFKRCVELPGEVKADDVKAELKDGVLTLTFPKADPETGGSRRIAVS